MNARFRQKRSSAIKRNIDWKEKIWKSNIFSLLLIILLIASFIKVGQEIMLRLEIKREIDTLQTQLDDLEYKKSKIDKLITYLKTDEYIEKQARLELNLSKPGEKQINLLSNEEEGEFSSLNNTSNIKKWFNYFFD